MPASLIEPKNPSQTWIWTKADNSHQPVSPAGTVVYNGISQQRHEDRRDSMGMETSLQWPVGMGAKLKSVGKGVIYIIMQDITTYTANIPLYMQAGPGHQTRSAEC